MLETNLPAWGLELRQGGVVVYQEVVKQLLREWQLGLVLSSQTGPGHSLELRVTSKGGKGWPNHSMALPAWIQGLFGEFLY